MVVHVNMDASSLVLVLVSMIVLTLITSLQIYPKKHDRITIH